MCRNEVLWKSHRVNVISKPNRVPQCSTNIWTKLNARAPGAVAHYWQHRRRTAVLPVINCNKFKSCIRNSSYVFRAHKYRMLGHKCPGAALTGARALTALEIFFDVFTKIFLKYFFRKIFSSVDILKRTRRLVPRDCLNVFCIFRINDNVICN